MLRSLNAAYRRGRRSRAVYIVKSFVFVLTNQVRNALCCGLKDQSLSKKKKILSRTLWKQRYGVNKGGSQILTRSRCPQCQRQPGREGAKPTATCWYGRCLKRNRPHLKLRFFTNRFVNHQVVEGRGTVFLKGRRWTLIPFFFFKQVHPIGSLTE